MKKKVEGVLVYVPKEFLKEFDKETGNLYTSRNEAIRAGMITRQSLHRKMFEPP